MVRLCDGKRAPLGSQLVLEGQSFNAGQPRRGFRDAWMTLIAVACINSSGRESSGKLAAVRRRNAYSLRSSTTTHSNRPAEAKFEGGWREDG